MDRSNDAPGSHAAGSAPADPLIGRTLDGRYRIVSLIAHGGMGRIYKAVQQPLERTVALKVLSPHNNPHNDMEDFSSRFFREASICSKLTHPNTVRIYDYGQTDDGVYFIAMEYLEGQTLRQAMAKDAPLAPWRCIDLMLQICASLAEAHSMGLIHRDLKPSNIILSTLADGKEFVNVVDFGLVKDLAGAFGDTDATQAGIIIGSPMYMSPEQILQSDLTERSDIYSLGVIMYGAFSGRKPFRQESPLALMNCHINVAPPPFAEINPDIEIAPNLEWVVQTCLEKDPNERFASVQELSRALKACDLELRGALPGLVMRLEAGRVILPLEFEERVDRRSRAGVADSGAHAMSGGTLSTMTRGSVAAVVNEEPEPANKGFPKWALAVPVLALLLGVGIVAILMGGGEEGEGDATAATTEEPATVEPAAVAPGSEDAKGEAAGSDEAGTKAPDATPPSTAPSTAAPTTTAPASSKPAASSTPSSAKPASTASTPAATAPTAAPDEGSATPADDPAADATATEAEQTPPQTTPPETKKEDDWATTPASDIRDPWED